ncbi:MAG: hypothetical protein J6S85_05585 [Methanobrevibacter sp.]|nr:hypothetical protein [Methanobrevibacter sp.]
MEDSSDFKADALEDAPVLGMDECDNIVSSSDEDGCIGIASSEDEGLVEDNVLCSSSYNALKDSNNGVSSNTYYVDAGNFNDFFNENQLKPEYANSTLVFNGSFENYGILKFYSNDTLISSINSSFYNTAFDLGASGIILSNLNIVLDEEFEDNEYAGIFIHADNVTIYNCSLTYNCPDNVTAFGIYSDGHNDDFTGLNIVNNTINLYGHGLGPDYYNYAILMRNTHDSVVYGNRIYCELPIKYILWTFRGAYGMASMDTVAAFAGDYCENLTLSNNDIHTFVNSQYMNFPTLDTVILYGCSHSLIENNSIRCEDLFTQVGHDNYLYALDLHNLNDVTVIGNNISVFTNGGMPGSGTAYPIQINGPVDHVKIAFNNLTTFNRGPNCGIYSNNYGGDTFIDIISNFINVTGDATLGGANPAYCLVTGIEVQDNGDNILNNTIIVNNLGDYRSAANVYGISYVQSIGGRHTYNIQFNNITTNGNYGVKILGNIKDSITYNSTISNNILNTHTTSSVAGASTNDQVKRPDGTIVSNNTNGRLKNNMSEDYYPDWLKDYVRNGSGRGTGDFAWMNRFLDPSSNGTGFSGAVGNGTAPWGSGNASGNRHGSHDGDVSGRGNNSESSSLRGSLNSTRVSPGLSGSSLPANPIASPSDAGSSAANPNAYEIDEHDNVVSKSSDYLQLGLICIVALLLLLVGYKRQKDKEEEE